jgi:hypothetical protein
LNKFKFLSSGGEEFQVVSASARARLFKLLVLVITEELVVLLNPSLAELPAVTSELQLEAELESDLRFSFKFKLLF